MKKLMLIMLLGFLFVFPVKTSSLDAFSESGNLIDGDFSNGVPDAWDIYNAQSTQVIDNKKTRIFAGQGTNPNDGSKSTQITLELDLPPGSYRLDVDSVYTTENYVDDSNLSIFAGTSSGNFFSLSGDYGEYSPKSYDDTFLYIKVEDNENLGSITLYFEGGVNSLSTLYDYMDITSLELVRLTGVDYYDNVKLTNNIDGFVGSVDEPTQFTSSNLSNSTIYLDSDLTGLLKAVDEGTAIDGWTYSKRPYDFKLENDTTGDFITFSYQEYYDTTQGDIASSNFDYPSDFPIKVHVFMNDPTGGEDIYPYPLEDYYMYQWTLTQTQATSGNLIPKDFGIEEYFTDERLRRANIVLYHGTEEIDVVLDGDATGLPVTDNNVSFEQYYETNDFFGLQDPDTNERFLFYTDENVTDIRGYNFDFDTSVSEITIQAFLPKDVDTLGPPTEAPDNPTSPGGAADSIHELLATFNMDNMEGNVIFTILILLPLNIILIFAKIKGFALPIINIAVLGLLFYGGFVPFWVMLILVMILGLMFVGMRGGMQQYE